MRRGGHGTQCVLAALVLGLSVSALPGQEPDAGKGDRPAGGWWSRLWPTWGQAKEELPVIEEEAEPAVPPEVRKQEAEEYHRTVYFRRERVCDRLIDIASVKGDKKLYAEAERLNDLAFQIYLHQSGQKSGTFGGQLPDTSGAVDSLGDTSRLGPEEGFIEAPGRREE